MRVAGKKAPFSRLMDGTAPWCALCSYGHEAQCITSLELGKPRPIDVVMSNRLCPLRLELFGVSDWSQPGRVRRAQKWLGVAQRLIRGKWCAWRTYGGPGAGVMPGLRRWASPLPEGQSKSTFYERG